MAIQTLSRRLAAAGLFAAPVFGLIAAIVTPALKPTRGEEISAIAAAPGRFCVYALGRLLSSYLLVPAVFALTCLVRTHRPAWAYLAGGLAQLGLLVAIGDAATELMFWQMGAPGASHA